VAAAILYFVAAIEVAGNSTQQRVKIVDCRKESVCSQELSDSSNLSYLSNETGLAMPSPQSHDEINPTWFTK
jgi:hypothetical protein